MKHLRLFSTLAIAMAVATGVACSSDQAPLAPPADATPDASLLGGLLDGTTGTIDGLLGTSTGSLLACNVTETKSTNQWVGPSGGIVRVGKHSLAIPPGALTSYTRIKATAPKGDIVLVNFEPHGLKFQKPTALTLSYSDCGLLSGVHLNMVYIADDQTILETLLSLNDLLRQTVTGKVDHFSGYALADRKGSTTSSTDVDGGF